MPTGQGHQHEGDAVAAGEVGAVLAVERVAQALALRPGDHRLGEETHVAGGGQRDVLERQPDPSARAGGVAVPQRAHDAQRRVQAAGQVPGRQHVVDGPRLGRRAGDQREAHPGVDGVVHPGAAVGATGDLQMDQVGPAGHQRVVPVPVPADDVGDQDAAPRAAFGDEPGDQLLTVGAAHVDGDRALALVQPGPVDALAVVGQRPAAVVRGAADGVHPDHLGTELGQRHPGQRHRHETRDLDDPNPGQRSGRARRSGHCVPFLARRRFVVSQPVPERRLTYRCARRLSFPREVSD